VSREIIGLKNHESGFISKIAEHRQQKAILEFREIEM
jgi:hypothetical protein